MAQTPLDQTEDTVFLGFRLVESMAATVDEIAQRRSSSRSDLMREALKMLIEAEEVQLSA